MGVVVESAQQILGRDPFGMRSVMQRTQPDGSRSGPGDTDRTIDTLGSVEEPFDERDKVLAKLG